MIPERDVIRQISIALVGDDRNDPPGLDKAMGHKFFQYQFDDCVIKLDRHRDTGMGDNLLPNPDVFDLYVWGDYEARERFNKYASEFLGKTVGKIIAPIGSQYSYGGLFGDWPPIVEELKQSSQKQTT